MTSYVDLEFDPKWDFDIEQLSAILLEAVMDYESCPYEATVNMVITDSETVHQINKEYRDIDNTTDVLSFPSLDFETPGDFAPAENDEAAYFDPETGELMLGDIIINYERVNSQAKEYGHSTKREFAFLMTHSLFHLCGYDHMTPEDAQVMEKRQEEVLNQLGITRD